MQALREPVEPDKGRIADCCRDIIINLGHVFPLLNLEIVPHNLAVFQYFTIVNFPGPLFDTSFTGKKGQIFIPKGNPSRAWI